MSLPLTDEQYDDWVMQFCGIDPRQCRQPAAPLSKAEDTLSADSKPPGPAPLPPARSDDPQWKVLITGSDQAGYDVDYSWPGEGKEPLECTINVVVTYSRMSKKPVKTEEFTSKNKIHNTGTGWAWFDGKSALDDRALEAVRINPAGSSCGGRPVRLFS